MRLEFAIPVLSGFFHQPSVFLLFPEEGLETLVLSVLSPSLLNWCRLALMVLVFGAFNTPSTGAEVEDYEWWPDPVQKQSGLNEVDLG